MKSFGIALLTLCISMTALAGAIEQECLNSLKLLRDNSVNAFIPHIDKDPESFNNSLALNVNYLPVKKLRPVIEDLIGRPLKFFTTWDEKGEAHVTVITPPEFVFALRHHITMDRIHEIARQHDIQKADLRVLGIGSAAKVIDNAREETFFVIVESDKLRQIRYAIYEEFITNGGYATAFDPTWFFPHITIGYTKTDLHETDGVLKDLRHSLDTRFGPLDLPTINSN